MAETIGERLQKQRLARHLTLEQAAEATRIRLPYLQALEKDDFTAMPSAVQGRGFLRLYAQYLGLDVDALLDEMRQAAAQKLPATDTLLEEPQPADESLPTEAKPPPWKRLWRRGTTFPSRPVAGAVEPEAGSSLQAETPPTQASIPPEAETATSSDEIPARVSADQLPVQPEAEVDESASVAAPPRLPLLKRLFSPSKPSDADSAENLPERSSLLPSSTEIFCAIGAELRARRELLSLALDEVERHVRVRRHMLQAIEDGRFDDLPSPVQARGMLSNYAAFLDLDVEEVLMRFAEGLQARRRERQIGTSAAPPAAKRTGRLNGWHSFLAADFVVGMALILSLFIFVVWAAAQIFDRQRQLAIEAEQTQAPSISDVLLATSDQGEGITSPTPTLILDEVAAPLQTLTPTPALVLFTPPPLDIVQVNINVLERTFLRVLVDGQVKFEGRPIPGSAYSFEGKKQIEIWAGSGAALQVIYNQKDQGRLGGVGEVVIRIYTLQAVLTPTATTVPTATATPPPTATPIASPTLPPTQAGE